MRRSCLRATLAMIVLSAMVRAGDWPQFRGPAGLGISDEKNPPVRWGPDENIAWKFALPGPGNSSPIVSNGRVFITCAEDEGRRRNLYCLDAASGELLWTKTVVYSERERMHQTNHYCAATPAADGERVVVWFGSAGLYCCDFAGRELWNRDLGRVEHIWGYGSSPIIHEGRVYLNFGPGVESFIAALELGTGEVLWKVDEPGGVNDRTPRWVGSWSIPIIATVDGRQQLLCSMPNRVVACEPATGEILWTLGGLAGQNDDLMYTSLVISGERAVAMAGFRGPAAGFKLGGSGDVTEENTLWKTEGQQPQRIGSGVIVDGKLYMANADGGTAQCFDVATGEVLWQDRLNAGAHWGSTVYAGGLLYATGQRGVTVVFKPNPERLEAVATNEMGEATNATPAFANGRAYLRTDEALYCIAEE